MFRFNRVMRPLRQLFRPNAPLKSPAVMYSGGAGASGHRKVLPGELMRSVVRLTCESSAKGGICDVYLVGAVPYAPESLEEVSREREKACQEIKAVISSLKPEVVFLGLDPSLSHDLEPEQMLSRIIGSLIDQEVITEYRVAYEEAQKHGANVILGDRPRKITLGRANPSLVDSAPLILTPNMLMNVADFDVDRFIYKWFGDSRVKKLILDRESKLKKIFVDERDRYMSATLLKVAREHNSVVAVVGKWHLPGIQKYWKQPIEVEELLISPKLPVTALLKRAAFWFLIWYVICIM